MSETKSPLTQQPMRADSAEAAASIEEALKDRQYPSNPRNAARAGYEAAVNDMNRRGLMAKPLPNPEPGFAYFTFASTGCTCCRNENRVFGPFSTFQRARTERDSNASTTIWASQYAKNGDHKIGRVKITEVLANGSFIIGNRIMECRDEAVDAELGHPDRFDLDIEYLEAEELRTPERG